MGAESEANQSCSLIEERGLTQTQAARVLGILQPKVSLIVRGASYRILDCCLHRLPLPLSRAGVSAISCGSPPRNGDESISG